MEFASSSWKITKNCDSVSKRDNPKKRQSPAKQDLHSKKWNLLPPAGRLPKIVTASQSETTPRRDNLQQSRIFIQRNGICFLQLEDYQNCDSVSKRDNPKKRQSPAKQDLHPKKWTLLPPAG
ncbi:hypothetical protein CDAR_288461 [Caerostris darwini]|uniref:Uncharacterized protein n=1 Tax=Caerostris darwini TaxID=1538125 RepID=A0AAV4U212_9ARAC|nr:hypothetical protein CDAR_288461 [Caerostris darwini]